MTSRSAFSGRKRLGAPKKKKNGTGGNGEEGSLSSTSPAEERRRAGSALYPAETYPDEGPARKRTNAVLVAEEVIRRAIRVEEEETEEDLSYENLYEKLHTNLYEKLEEWRTLMPRRNTREPRIPHEMAAAPPAAHESCT